MQCLHAKTTSSWDADPFVVRITRTPTHPQPYREREALFVDQDSPTTPGFKAYLSVENGSDLLSTLRSCAQPLVKVPSSLSYLGDGDIVFVDPRRGDIRVLYRKRSRFNSLFVTQQCNSKCLMCSQPPHGLNDDYLVKQVLEAIPLMDVNTPELIITGGEPTLLQDKLLEIVQFCASYLPHTPVLLLSNGRFFSYLTYCEAISHVKHPDFTIGIPLYSNISEEHDFIVQAKGAFDQTIKGIMNLARCRVRIELRIVIHKLNYQRLPEWSEFVARNLPFVSHVALMGMEPTGYAKANLDELWIDPIEYSELLYEAVRQLIRNHICTSIYNHQLCTLDTRLWRWARQSISDWKDTFLMECQTCSVRAHCCGFFASCINLHSSGVKPIPSSAAEASGFL